MKYVFAICFWLHTIGYSQIVSIHKPIATDKKPKLIVGVIVDQMRNDYIYRYWNRYGNGGFKKLVTGGYYFKNAHYNYIPTYTGPGHACVYTGSTPSENGIIANEWFDRDKKDMMNCVEDKSVNPVGTTNEKHKRSPKNLLASTLGDELKINSNGKAKVFGIALKDRSAIFPAGHAADGAFWLDDKTGNFVSSTWYMNQLPEWVNAFNNRNLIMTYFAQGWNTLYPIETYTNSISDDNRYEKAHVKKDKSVFPYTYQAQIDGKNYGTIAATTHGNTLTKEMVLACLKAEQLGKDEVTDLLAISFSSPDIIGHSTGPRSVEMEDTYLRLDKDLEDLINQLDKEVGKDNYTLFLTADHGGADVPNHLVDNKIPAGNINKDSITLAIKKYALKNFGDSVIISSVSNDQVFLNHNRIADLKLNTKDIKQSITEFLMAYKGVAEVYPNEVLKTTQFTGRENKALLQRGYNHQRSGDLLYILQPAWMEYQDKGTTHGSSYIYDTHVPLIFYGSGVVTGQTQEYVTITQIAPTLCAFLQINFTNATTANPLLNYWQGKK
jgi:predicted AlkP superfamily pyrophosphatase or phosphodiesterase